MARWQLNSNKQGRKFEGKKSPKLSPVHSCSTQSQNQKHDSGKQEILSNDSFIVPVKKMQKDRKSQKKNNNSSKLLSKSNLNTKKKSNKTKNKIF